MDILFVGTTLLYVVPVVLIGFIILFRMREERNARIRKEEIDKKAATLLESLRPQYQNISYDETSEAFFTEAKKGKVGDQVLLRALSILVDEKKQEESATVNTSQPDDYWFYFWLSAIFVAIIVSAVLFAFTLIIPSISFSFVFVAIITAVIVGGMALFKQS